MVGEHRLGPPQMGVGRNDHPLILRAAADKGLLQVDEAAVDLVDGVADPEPQIGGNLIVAAAAGMQLPAQIARAGNQCLLDVHVDVFELSTELKAAFVDLAADGLEVGGDLVGFRRAQQAHIGQHAGMGCGAQNIVPVEPAIEANAFGELLDPAVGRCRKNAFPRLCSHPKTLA